MRISRATYVQPIKGLIMEGNKIIGVQPTNYEKFKADCLRDPKVRQAYDALQPKYDYIQSLITKGIPFELDADGNPIYGEG